MSIEIAALSTGTVRIKTAMTGGSGVTPYRQMRMLWGRGFTGPAPILTWLIDHPEGPLLVDTGELSSTKDPPIARFEVSRDEEIDRLLAARGLGVGDLREVVLTHLHGDHMNGVRRLAGARVAASAQALRRGGARLLARRGASARGIELADEPIGAFTRSAALTADGLVRAVPLPGHARGQIGVIVARDDHHVLIGGDSAYTEAQLRARRPDGVALSRRVAIGTMATVLEHARSHPTVYLPSHDPESPARLREGRMLAA